MKMRKPKDIIINGKTLKQLLDEHAEWLKDGGWRKWAILNHADLSHTDLKGVNLSHASLEGINLYGSDLRHANLEYSDLSHSNLGNTNLDSANLHNTCLEYSNLVHSNLYGAELVNASLRYAKLSFAQLSGSDLRYADLRHVDLTGSTLCNSCIKDANFVGANLESTDIDDAFGNYISYRKGKILTEDIIGYKTCYRDTSTRSWGRVIVTLKIPRGAVVFSINGHKCRTNRAKVIAIDGADRAYSTYSNMSYYVGDEFNVYNFNCEYNVECSAGIHFFMTLGEALNYLNY